VARGDADLEGVAEAPHHAQPGVVLDQPAKNPTQIQQGQEHEKFRRKTKPLPEFRGGDGRSQALPCVDARGAAGGEVGSLAERAAAAAPPGRHHLRPDSAGAEGTGWLWAYGYPLTAPGLARSPEAARFVVARRR